MKGFARCIVVSILVLLSGSCTEPGSWALVDEQYRYVLSGRAWKRRVAVSIDSTGIPEELRDFPLLVTLTPADLDIQACGDGGRSIQFRDSDGAAVLAHEVDTWNIAGESHVWVRVPGIPANTPDTRIWLYFDNPYASEPDRRAEVWSNGYLGVWHLNEKAPGTYSDASPNRWDGGPAGGSFTRPASAEGIIGGSQEYALATDAILLPAREGAELGPVTISFWIRAQLMASGRRFFQKGPLDIRSASALIPPHKLAFEIGFDDGDPGTNPDRLLLEQVNELQAAMIGAWYWYCLTWTGTGECGGGNDSLPGAHTYRNGVLRSGNRGVQDDGRGDYLGDANEPAYIGNWEWNNKAILGRFDEVRISGVRRSPAWILAEYRSMTGSLVTLGVPETVPYE